MTWAYGERRGRWPVTWYELKDGVAIHGWYYTTSLDSVYGLPQ